MTELTTNRSEDIRRKLCGARRVVVKVGTRLLANHVGKPEPARLRALVDGLTALHKSGREVVLVTSGAIGMGIDGLGRTTRPTALPELQAAAAIGQARLMELYGRQFARKGIAVGQVLLTHDDLQHRTRHLNARNTMRALLENKVLPIVNENDVVSVDEIKVGDNDVLAALVSLLVDADALVLLTSVNGLRTDKGAKSGKRIPYVSQIDDTIRVHAGGKGSAFSTGGMLTKLRSAEIVTASGALAVIADGRKGGVLQSIFKGADLGTVFGPAEGKFITPSRKQWIAFFNRSQGSIVVDTGARQALETQGRSLLPIGVKAVRGKFEAGAFVNVHDQDENLVARGLVQFSSGELERIKGRKSAEVLAIVGAKSHIEVIHRDNMVVMSAAQRATV